MPLALGQDELLGVCACLEWRDIVSLGLTCRDAREFVFKGAHSSSLWRAAHAEALPYGGDVHSSSEHRGQRWMEAFVQLQKRALGPSSKVLELLVQQTSNGVRGGQLQGIPSMIKAVDARSKLDYAHSESPLLAWSQLLECHRGLELRYRPTQRLDALPLPDPGRADNVGVALVRRCFPFGAQGTALFGHPTLRYFEVAILAPEEEASPGGSSSSSGSSLAGSAAESVGLVPSGPEGALGMEVQQQLGGPTSSASSTSSGEAGSGSSLAAPPSGAQQQRSCGVSVGVVESRQAHSMLSNGLHLGWYSGSWEGSMQSVGYHADGGRLFPAPADTRWGWDGEPFGAASGPGDMVGCGVDLARGLLFFTRNGEALGVVAPGGTPGGALPGCLGGVPLHRIQPLSLKHSQLAVCLHGQGDRVAINLGQSKFRFDLASYLKASAAGS